jgi:hypothetical protein
VVVKSGLELTRNFVDLHLYACGKSEVPEVFHRWACISLLAAAVGDNVHMMKLHKKLFPNMYIFLIGPSGLGKGEAIDAAIKLATDVPVINCLRTKVTAQGLIDFLRAKQRRKDGTVIWLNQRMYLIMPELAMALGTGRLADQFIKHMTDFYSCTGDMIKERTRTHGSFEMPSPILNWLVGTTKEWLMSSITKDALYGGFIARTACVQAQYNLDKRWCEPEYPPDREIVEAYLYARLVKLTRLRDVEMKLDEKAQAAVKYWYDNREAPDPDDPLCPTWKREHDFVLKLSMIFALAEERTTISVADFYRAEKHARELFRLMPDLITFAQTTEKTEAVARAQAIIRRAKQIRHDLLLRRLNITNDHFEKDVIATLKAMKLIRVDKTKDMFNPTYHWIERTIHISKEEAGTEEGRAG